MNDIQAGDTIRAVRKGKPSEKAEGVITYLRGDYIETEVFAFRGDTWDFEVIERPYKLPTEPGVYAPANANERLEYKRIFRLNSSGTWEEFTDKSIGKFSHDELVKIFTNLRWNLKQLAIKED